ncbi:hypothetical protein MPRI_52830 [Mycobacterium paraintracellulare]|uniref:TGS domain-containing protein n=1 Tax=Mycobacterium paraintracellulare TaxID=1138383 RepID=A0ABM7KFT3_9MYCO|nr:hypothetical protein MPRI_52830 [Mycobacterium paraintracellulare]
MDFAYAVHTEVGHRCIGARVNGRLVALERKLENGEVVEVFTSKAANAGPSRDWQQFVVSPRAKAKIRQWFAKERREEALEAGKDAMAREVRRGGLPLQRLVNGETLSAVARELHYLDVSAPTRRSVRGTCRPGTSCSGCWPNSAASTRPKKTSPNGPPRRPCCGARAAATTSGSRSRVPRAC